MRCPRCGGPVTVNMVDTGGYQVTQIAGSWTCDDPRCEAIATGTSPPIQLDGRPCARCGILITPEDTVDVQTTGDFERGAPTAVNVAHATCPPMALRNLAHAHFVVDSCGDPWLNRAMTKDVSKLIRQVEQWPGWRIEDRGNSFMIFPADRSQRPISIHKTPSDHRWLANARSLLRKAGGQI